MQEVHDKMDITETVNCLFVHTDNREWKELLEKVFADKVFFDMSSMGAGEPETMAARDICAMWEQGFKGLDAIHHQAGNYIIDLKKEEADVVAYAIAGHYKKAATKGQVRTFTGSYNIHVIRTGAGWRIDRFRYNLKYMEGNISLE